MNACKISQKAIDRQNRTIEEDFAVFDEDNAPCKLHWNTGNKLGGVRIFGFAAHLSYVCDGYQPPGDF
jgi:hypothetical protein